MLIEHLVSRTDKVMELIWFDRANIWDIKAMSDLFNKYLAIEEFAKEYTVSAVTWTVKYRGLVMTNLDDSMTRFNNWAVILNNSDTTIMFDRMVEYAYSKSLSLSPFREVGTIIAPVDGAFWLAQSHYKVLPETSQSGRSTVSWKFMKNVQIEDVEGNILSVPSIKDKFIVSDFNWDNIAIERLKVAIRPTLDAMIKQDKDTLVSDYNNTVQKLIRLWREMEATMNKDNMEAYVEKIISNIARSKESLTKYENIESVTEGGNFEYTIVTKPLLSEWLSDCPIGSYTIKVWLKSWDISIKNNYGRFTHPHVQTDWDVCWGNLAVPVKDWLKHWDLESVIVLCLELLQSFYPESSYVPRTELVANVKWSDKYKELHRVVIPETKEVFNWYNIYTFSV